jgi:excisionase family DNA binding protein
VKARKVTTDTAAAVRKTLTIPEACHTLGVGRCTVFRLIAEGQLRTLKIGNRRLVTPKAIDDFLTRAERDATA